MKNASNIVQHEWFKISSTAQADPLCVEFYLDQFEQHSSSLLGHVVNLVDSSGNTAMHYAVSHGNFDVVSILIDSKVCDVNRSNHAGYTPVMLAALAQVRNSTHASVVKRLFQMSDVNVRARLVSFGGGEVCEEREIAEYGIIRIVAEWAATQVLILGEI